MELVNDVLNGPNGDNTVIIITYDENGGFWDHVAPPVIDTKWGPGTRVPGIIISPFARRGYVDHTQYETVSILSFIEKRWHLSPDGQIEMRIHLIMPSTLTSSRQYINS